MLVVELVELKVSLIVSVLFILLLVEITGTVEILVVVISDVLVVDEVEEEIGTSVVYVFVMVVEFNITPK